MNLGPGPVATQVLLDTDSAPSASTCTLVGSELCEDQGCQQSLPSPQSRGMEF